MSALLSGIMAAFLAVAPLPLKTNVLHSRWLARCSAFPETSTDGITRVAAHRPGALQWILGKTVNGRLHVGVLVAYRIATYAGVGVYAVHGPTILRDRMAADPNCSHAIAWPDVSSLPQAALNEIASGLICCGASSAGRAWRCDRSAALGGDVTVSRLDGYGPGVVAGTDPCEAYPPLED